ncbi:class IV adenylate cyclase [Clostridium sp. 'White wine YQ']|uniref:class IV adenylate cyclase n=1 Tax=Clostridium sp. 'White wine YQ' TaxID=3027474 RepID=UPI0023664E5E|nr:CYTH domain-containing protein [Clostridium sp. 'White wine YQ']MDD7794931.1 CYTH domain-containing protein [Clostridium sp. 'White wine YQ']
MKELETRILDIDLDILRNNLIKIKAEKVKEENQINNIFDYPDRRLLNEKGYARIRIVNDLINNKIVSYMTTKKMLSQERFKVMEENECIIEDGEVGKKIFNSLGLELVQSIKKYRESYKYKNTLIEIDINDKSFCPFPYVEFETNSEEELEEVLHLLGYSLDDTSSKTIYEILSERNIQTEKGL